MLNYAQMFVSYSQLLFVYIHIYTKMFLRTSVWRRTLIPTQSHQPTCKSTQTPTPTPTSTHTLNHNRMSSRKRRKRRKKSKRRKRSRKNGRPIFMMKTVYAAVFWSASYDTIIPRSSVNIRNSWHSGNLSQRIYWQTETKNSTHCREQKNYNAAWNHVRSRN